MTTDEMTEKIFKLREAGLTAQLIADRMNAEGDRTPSGLKITTAAVYACITHFNQKNKKLEKKALQLVHSKKKPTMETLVADEPRKKGKVIAIIADAEDVGEFLKGWVGNG